MLTQNSPLSLRVLAWMQERFPFANALLFFILYLVASCIGRFTQTEEAIVISLQDLIGCGVTWSFFLLLRIFDEHKDYDLDVQNHPERVLQSGLITLKHLKILGLIAIILQLTWSAYLDQGFASVVQAWIILMAWALLMTAEFFCGEWLTRRLTLYAFSHMLVMPFILWWLLQMGQPGATMTNLFLLAAALAFSGGFTFEITRKTRGPEEERATVDSYSQRFGSTGAGFIVLTLLALMLGLELALLDQLTSTPFWVGIILLILFFLAGVLSLVTFIRSPSKKGRSINEAIVGLTMLGGNSIIIATILLERGVEFRLWVF